MISNLLRGNVVKGRQLGRTIGFPTANIEPIQATCSLPHGVYGVRVLTDGKWYDGIMNIGNRPTFDDGFHTSFEVHIFNFNQDIYNQLLHVEVCFFIREETAFSGIDHLVSQIKQDVHYTKEKFEFHRYKMAL
ncbi:riboflavin kinase [Ammoniphilus sp. 3BR4]|uniref:riboflavin kinase n=1 Tax=Ammoniphilus sp. 3BR4 TaxID=3158265 RepID=UPI003467CE48